MISTKNISNGGSISKVLEPGNKVIKINSIKLEEYPYRDNAYHFVMHCEGQDLGKDFEGFYIDPAKPKTGRYKGQVGNVKAGEWAFSDFITQSGIEISRDEEILKFVKNLCDLFDSEWLDAQDNKHETIEELVIQFNEDKPFQGAFFNACLCGKEYTNKNGYTNYDIFLPKFTRNGLPFEPEDVDSSISRVYTFDPNEHIRKKKVSKEVDSFKKEEEKEETTTKSDDFEL